VEKGYLRIGPRRATLHIEQDVRCHEIAAARRQGIKPVCTGVGESSAAAQTCTVKHIAEAKDPRVPLVITADLPAASNATIARRHGSTGSNVSNFKIRPSPTDVAADIASGPKIRQWCRRHLSWSWRPPRQNRCRYKLACSKGNGSSGKQSQRISSHRFLLEFRGAHHGRKAGRKLGSGLTKLRPNEGRTCLRKDVVQRAHAAA